MGAKRITRHNGRAGKNGVYKANHNDRAFDTENAEHIDEKRVDRNIYWDCYRGITQGTQKFDDKGADITFADVEKAFYSERYDGYLDGQHERNVKTRHTERDRSITDLLNDKRFCPEESIFQIGTMEDSVTPEELAVIFAEFINEMDRRFGEHVHVIDWALHLDEATPHIHERHVFDCENRYGEIQPVQEKALEALGFEPPDSEKKTGRYNNRKMVFDAACRTMLFDICKKHGLHLEEEPAYGGRQYLEKQDFILAKQKEQLERQSSQMQEQEAKLEELTMKIEDVESLIDEVSDAAYDKAVEVVTDTVKAETQKEDVAAIADYRDWLLKPERKAPPEKREYAAKMMDKVIEKIMAAAGKMLAKVQHSLMKPEIRKAGTEQIKEKARESIKDKMEKARIAADKSNRERWEREGKLPGRKQDMEL